MNQIFAMGGYELYVWGSFGCALAVFAWNVLAPMSARRAMRARLRRRLDEQEDA